MKTPPDITDLVSGKACEGFAVMLGQNSVIKVKTPKSWAL